MARLEIIAHDSLRQLSAQFQRMQQEMNNLRRRLSAFRCELGGDPHQFVAMSSSLGVDAYSGSVAGHADVTLCTVSTSGLVENTTHAVHAYNLSLTAVSANAIIQIKREEKTGRFMIDFENCE
jgi:hypothetical protein